MYYIESDRLRVELLDPEGARRLTTRFDHTSFVSEVILDGSVRLCTSEPRNLKDPTTGGRGLCCEFQFDPSGETDVGGRFPKLGVGLLTKFEDRPYKFSNKYECVPFVRRVEQLDGSTIVFTTLPGPSLGYAAQVARTFHVEGNLLTAAVLLENVGQKEISFHEYCHNFMSLDGMALGPDYSLTLPGVKDLDRCVREGRNGGKEFVCSGETVSFAGFVEGSSRFEIPAERLPDTDAFHWTLSHKSSMITVRGEERYRPVKVPVWVDNHMMCPEATFAGTVRPGEKLRWERRWTFDKEERER